MEEIVNNWSAELEERTKDFMDISGEVREWDRVLRENGEQVCRYLFRLTLVLILWLTFWFFFFLVDFCPLHFSPSSIATSDTNFFVIGLRRKPAEGSRGYSGQLRSSNWGFGRPECYKCRLERKQRSSGKGTRKGVRPPLLLFFPSSLLAPPLMC